MPIAIVSSEATLAENAQLPGAGCSPGERQYMTGPVRTSGAVAAHPATEAVPNMNGTFFAISALAICTVVCGLP